MAENDSSEDDVVGAGRRPHRWPLLRILLAVTNIVLLAGVVVLAYTLDARAHDGDVARNVTLAGSDISGLSPQRLGARVDELIENYRTASLVVDDGDVTFSIPTRGIELDIDRDETVTNALSVRRTGGPLVKFAGWAKAFFSPTATEIAATFDDELLTSAIRQGDQGERSDPVEPSFEIRDDRLVATAGTDGRGIDPMRARDLVGDVITGGPPLRMSLPRETLEPRFERAEAERLADRIENQVLDRPVTATSVGVSRELTADVIRPWITTRAGADRLEMSVAADVAARSAEELFAGTGTRAREPVWTVTDGRPSASPGVAGTTCCAPGAGDVIASVLGERLSGGGTETIDLGGRAVAPKITDDEVPGLGIDEVIGSFTTNFEAGQPRVTNITRISDLVRGAVIEPGETFSLNTHVGRRTTQNGFVEGGVIQDGEFAESVGGGISQFATTLFNASFFGGLDFGEYQAHTIYISRYPYGREATISFPRPDLQIRNTTPYGVLIWPTYSGNSVTVTLYSTRFATGEQTNQSTGPSGRCTRVTTERTRSYVDGRTATDTVSAIYQPREGETC